MKHKPEAVSRIAEILWMAAHEIDDPSSEYVVVYEQSLLRQAVAVLDAMVPPEWKDLDIHDREKMSEEEWEPILERWWEIIDGTANLGQKEGDAQPPATGEEE